MLWEANLIQETLQSVCLSLGAFLQLCQLLLCCTACFLDIPVVGLCFLQLTLYRLQADLGFAYTKIRRSPPHPSDF